MNLAEGNIMPMAVNDGFHGSGSHNILFRNSINGLNSTQAIQQKTVNLARGSYFHSVVGNILGDASWSAHYYDVPYPGGAWPWTGMYSLGWPTADGGIDGYIQVPWADWLKPTNQLDADVVRTLIRHGNYDYFNRAVVWADAISARNISESLFYTSKPDYFGALQWPPIGPDVNGFVSAIPAKARWDRHLSTGDASDLFN